MIVSLTSLKPILQNAACEIKFPRRRPVLGRPAFRRMLCTNSNTILNSIDGRITLNYRPSRGTPKYDPNQKNLAIVWDILMQDYRCVNCNSCELITTIPAGEAFWKYFKDNLMKLSSSQKTMFMDS
jgi:hypothetical protein